MLALALTVAAAPSPALAQKMDVSSRPSRLPATGLLYYAKADSATDTEPIANPSIAGALFQVIWSEVEREDGVCDWTQVDGWIRPWLAAGKKVAIRIMWSTSGYWPEPYYKTPTPQWVWSKGAVHAFHAPSGTEIPLAWDPIYERYAWRFLEQFASRYESNPGLLFVDVTPGAETNPYRFGTIDAQDPAFRTQFLSTRASDGRVYSEVLWLQTVEDWVQAAVTVFRQAPLLATLNVGGFSGSRLPVIGEFCVTQGLFVGQNGLKGSSYAVPAGSPFFGWADRTSLFFEMVAASGGTTGSLQEVMEAAGRIRCRYLNVYPEDVAKGTRGDPGFDPAFEAALVYGARTLAGNAPADTPPTITSIADQTTRAGSPIGPLAFEVWDAETPAASLQVTAASSRPDLVPATSIVLGGSGSRRTVTITPAAQLTGSAAITVTVSDGALAASTTFTLTVTSSAHQTLPDGGAAPVHPSPYPRP